MAGISMKLALTSDTSRRLLTRRLLIAALLTWVPMFGFEQPRLGDEEWIRQLHRFVKAFNEFLSALDDGKF
jgi:hypothetical protein